MAFTFSPPPVPNEKKLFYLLQLSSQDNSEKNDNQFEFALDYSDSGFALSSSDEENDYTNSFPTNSVIAINNSETKYPNGYLNSPEFENISDEDPGQEENCFHLKVENVSVNNNFFENTNGTSIPQSISSSSTDDPINQIQINREINLYHDKEVQTKSNISNNINENDFGNQFSPDSEKERTTQIEKMIEFLQTIPYNLFREIKTDNKVICTGKGTFFICLPMPKLMSHGEWILEKISSINYLILKSIHGQELCKFTISEKLHATKLRLSLKFLGDNGSDEKIFSYLINFYTLNDLERFWKEYTKCLDYQKKLDSLVKK
ncbi:hypothetical protein TRFO_15885 [Tritrichomonas foetus]|uniref:Uncharacterized protein n=1 Tax=Tritrichomonas foetus TaxID=1144522 RepID=A0A1J4KRF0_9EUKA|nr:hypothetical protein TRFO_15885 [Tritrichomonas foetus]|eukprot:OHT13865.1 hypothetical protein TRFO_15885 [Tritrichomonas foetus]